MGSNQTMMNDRSEPSADSQPVRRQRPKQIDARKLTLSDLRRKLHYDPVSGVFIWKETHQHRVGIAAGTLKSGTRQYRIINIGGVLYRANRLAWFYMTGEWPRTDVDHINGDRSDDRWSNLRLATRAQNNAYRHTQSVASSGERGVHFDPARRKPWRAFVSVENKTRVIGSFATKQEAANAYQKFTIERFGEFARFDGAQG